MTSPTATKAHHQSTPPKHTTHQCTLPMHTIPWTGALAASPYAFSLAGPEYLGYAFAGKACRFGIIVPGACTEDHSLSSH
jgi:hypothetical protein